MATSVFRPLRVATFAFLALVAVGFVVSAALTAHEEMQLYNAHTQMARLYQFSRVRLVVASRLITIAKGSPDAANARQDVIQQIDRLVELSLDPSTPAKLQALRVVVQRGGPANDEIIQTIELFHEVTLAEHARNTGVVAQLERESATQLRLELAIPIVLVTIGTILFPLAQRRVIKPLDAFGRQLARLADGEFTPAPVDRRVEPFLLPLHRQFNSLASRLQSLEAAHRARTASLEGEVRAATQQLLEQQRSLARADRLAATGELAASVAHELRNPLAALQMTLTNLRAELPDAEQSGRVDLMIQEVERLTRLLNGLLDSARHAPETPRPLRLAELVGEMLTLVRYQLPPEIQLTSAVDTNLTCHLPPDRLRQALLNLVLNAAGALAGGSGEIRIDAAVADRTLRISVSDDGPGFPAEVLETSIRPFFSTRERGTGLGLATVRRFARDLGGTVEVSNRQPHGAQVTLILPVEAEQV
jgi:two-component system NtrC family sensor kinase